MMLLFVKEDRLDEPLCVFHCKVKMAYTIC